MTLWYYVEHGQEQGPLSQDEILALLKKGRMTRQTLVWSEGMQDWARAGDCEAFFPSSASSAEKEGELPCPTEPPPLRLDPVPPEEEPTPPKTSSPKPQFVPRFSQAKLGPSTPWPRYFARSIDLGIFSVFCKVIGVLPGGLGMEAEDLWISMAMLLGYCFVEAGYLSIWQTTPGKALLGVHLQKKDGSPFRYAEALRRALRVFVRGFACGIPLLSLLAHWMAFQRLSERKKTSWDADGGFEVRQEPLGCGHMFLVLFCLLLLTTFVADP